MRKALFLLVIFFVIGCTKQEKKYIPGAALADDLETLSFSIKDDYRTQRPRLLFSEKGKLNLLAKKKKAPEVWELVVKSADEYLKGLRDAEGIKRGRKYYETASTIAGALSWYLEGNEAHKEESIKWIVEHCKVDIWGTGYGTNVDLVASHYLYNLSLAFDILYDEISDDDKKIIINGLKEHANAVYGHVKEMCKEDVRWDQNHFYIPAIALFTTGLVLLDEVPEAEEWVRYTYTGMQRSRYVLGDDGYYYEGTAYWVYAYHWHLRYADLLKRATGESAHNLPIFRKNYLFALHSHFPDRSGSFNIGDGGGSKGNPSILYGFADIFNDGKSQLAAKRRDGNISLTHPATDAASHFLWYNPDVEQASIDDIKPYRHFKDHDILFWRSSWDEDATACVFKCGPSVGHKAAGKLKEMTDWYTNDGHTHPDIGMFWLFARGKYLAIDTGYLYSKRSLDHNTLLIDGKGMANDGSYWVYRERDYDKFDAANIEETYLDKKFAYVRGDFSEVYTDIPGSFKIKRHLMISRDYMLVLDEIAADSEHNYSWLLHTNDKIIRKENIFVSESDDVILKVHCLAPEKYNAVAEKHNLLKGSPPHEPEPIEYGHLLRIDTQTPGKKCSFLNVLVPLKKGENEPVIKKCVTDKSVSCVEIKKQDYTDYFAASLGETGEQKVTCPENNNEYIKWNGRYGFLRVEKESITACGQLTGFKLKLSGISSVYLNGVLVEFAEENGCVLFNGK